MPGIKTAVVTGGAKRIGAAIVEDLCAHGWRVVIHCHTSRQSAETLAARLRGKGAGVDIVVADLGRLDALAQMFAEIGQLAGPADLLVNNASVFEEDHVGSLVPGDFQHHIDVNLAAPVFLSQEFARQLPDGSKGNIVNIIDQRVWKPNPQFFSYTLSKSALWAATRTLAQALAPDIRVNAIGPGPTIANRHQSAENFAKQSAALPLTAGPGLDEIGRTIRFLVDTPSVTGQMIAVDGGQHLAWETADVSEGIEGSETVPPAG